MSISAAKGISMGASVSSELENIFTKTKRRRMFFSLIMDFASQDQARFSLFALTDRRFEIYSTRKICPVTYTFTQMHNKSHFLCVVVVCPCLTTRRS